LGASDSAEAVGITKYDGVGNITGVSLFERHITIGSDDNGTVTNADLALYDFTTTEDIFFDVDGSNDLAACATGGCTDVEIYIKAGNTYQLGSGGNTTTHDIENNGTLALNGNTLRVSGSWDNNATTSSATSTVIFTSTGTVESIDETSATAASFYNLTLGEGSGTAVWSLDSDITVNNDLSVMYGSFFRNTSAIAIQKNLSTGANGVWSGVGTTTFSGSTAAIWSDATAGSQNIGNVVVDGTSKSVTLGGNVEAQSITIGADDTFDLSPTGYDITVNGNWVNNHTFNTRTGDVTFAATTLGNIITAGGSNFYNLRFNGAGGS
jgi:hypothetical protein